MFQISKQQLAAYSRPPLDKQRDQYVLEMEAAWALFSPKWWRQFKRTLTYDERKTFFGQVYDWCIQAGVTRAADFFKLAVLLMRAVYYQFDQDDIDTALSMIEDQPDDTEQAFLWIEYCLDNEAP